ncbi:MSMEG_1061 family FMN-dependent PPOX-type flavoprotein [Actinomycetospora termitidis]|uniref:Pyridoxamine 5'-phosphate oxidase family protein n=1 Tax=Actinomycetospora termitidis TaxID=3053470 RepID=A0ABT7MH79_9PSEU|nr:MSMEG_1061 family FMN-dependent PPOX-type flavoprotein [Actinomycetospora sp. Odt1-22]MDL5160021.1 pyridoxamine 5'-phosphate oxidase family protein [Actinomycetospora sp. Odt1-22]
MDDWTVITDEAALREVVAEPPRAVADKAIDHVDEESARFLAASPFFLFSTTGADGSVDVSPRGDPPGSVIVLEDGRRIAFGDRKGNRRLDSLRNVLERPQVGMLFLVPGSNDTLRVNGTAQIVRDPPFAHRLAVGRSVPDLAVVVTVEELFLHCAKAFLRSTLWDPQSWPDPADVPSAGRMARSQFGMKVPAGVIDAALRVGNRFTKY